MPASNYGKITGRHTVYIQLRKNVKTASLRTIGLVPNTVHSSKKLNNSLTIREVSIVFSSYQISFTVDVS